MEYKISLTLPQFSDCEPFEDDDDNLLTVEVNSKGKNISEDCLVFLTFSRNGLIGFATELLRYAHEWEKVKETHFHHYPIIPGENIVQCSGVCLAHGSSETILAFSNPLKTITEIVKDLLKNDENQNKTPDVSNEAEVQEMMEVLKQVGHKLGFIPTFKQK